jgi:hypothetical protein
MSLRRFVVTASILGFVCACSFVYLSFEKLRLGWRVAGNEGVPITRQIEVSALLGFSHGLDKITCTFENSVYEKCLRDKHSARFSNLLMNVRG